mgnify:CR=1 FL=1
MIYNNILEAVGHTPMVRLNRMVEEDSAQVLVCLLYTSDAADE